MFRKNKKKEEGFTIIETLIAITILMISITAPLYLAAKGLEVSNLAKQQIVAFYMAQDAYEEVKNIIDTNKQHNYTRAENGMLHGDLYDKCTGDDSVKCIIDTVTGHIERYTGQNIYYDKSLNIYGYKDYGDTVKTMYKRYVNIKMLGDTSASIDQVMVTVTIEWKPPYSKTQKYVLKTITSNW